MYLDATVPLQILALSEAGGPQRADFQQCASLIDCLHDAVPSMMTNEQRAAMSRGIAVLSFAPGGVELFGRQWYAEERWRKYQRCATQA